MSHRFAHTAEEIRQILDYDPNTGEFRWRYRSVIVDHFDRIWNTRRAGKIAGTRAHHGYWQIRIAKRSYYGHRLAWFYMTGEWPPDGLDHWDGDTGNNRFINLRIADQTQNNGNRRRDQDQQTPKGVSIHRCTGKWQARLKFRGKAIWLGVFDNPKDAAAAYERAALEHFGEFARIE